MIRLKDILHDFLLPRPPFALIVAVTILICLSLLPLVMIARARVTLSPQTAVHLFHDMDHQPKYKAQSTSVVFVDGRAMRPAVVGTVARGQIQDDDHYDRGFETDGNGNPVMVTNENDEASKKWVSGFPGQLTIDERFLKRGQKMFNIFCYPCHGRDGFGKGPVNERALELMLKDPAENLWVQVANLHQIDTQSGKLKYGEDLYPEGKLFNVITNGFNNMPAYGSQIDTVDRWSIVAYIRALQLSQHAPAEAVPPQIRQSMR